MKKGIIIALLLVVVGGAAVFFMTGSKTLRDGVYRASQSGAFGDTNVTIELKDGRIVRCELEALDKEGRVKDSSYGQDSGGRNYQLAQIALQGLLKYPSMLLESQNVDELEAVSGATVTFREFQTAVKEALKEAYR